MEEGFSIVSFQRLYGTDGKCLEAMKTLRFPEGTHCPKCQRVTKFHRVSNRSSYACQFCGHHISPLAGTIFEKSPTPLRLWFFAMYLLVQTRNGLSAKELERHLGVTYKTAWRILKQIRSEMIEGGDPLGGTVEIDETFIGGKGRNRRFVPNFNEKPKEIVMGMIQRGGRAVMKHIPTTGKWELLKQIQTHIHKSARVITDQYAGYMQLPKYGYKHEFVNHELTYVVGDVYTQNAECFWSHLKPSIIGTHRRVSRKHLQSYVDEFTFRYNHRMEPNTMFTMLLSHIAARPLMVEQSA